jgi:hypothetical protein
MPALLWPRSARIEEDIGLIEFHNIVISLVITYKLVVCLIVSSVNAKLRITNNILIGSRNKDGQINDGINDLSGIARFSQIVSGELGTYTEGCLCVLVMLKEAGIVAAVEHQIQ